MAARFLTGPQEFAIGLQERIINNALTEELDLSPESLTAAGIFQQFTRQRLEGEDQIAGIFRCDFESDQQRFVLNIPVHPAFAGIPSIEALGLDCNVRIRVTDCQKYGVRMEVVAAEVSSKPQHFFVDIVITSKA